MKHAPKFVLFSLCSLVIGAVSTASAATRLAGGQWESSLTTDGATHSAVYCISAAEADSINGNSKTGRAYAEKKSAGTRCAVKSFDIKGDTVSYMLACGERSISSRTAFHGDRSDGVIVTTVSGKTTTTSVKSRRLGECK